VAQAVAEVLGGLVYVNAVKPGHPAIFGPWPFVSDLRSGAMSGGSGEQGLLSAACAQMAQFYRLPGGSAAGMTDAKLPDLQAGYERGMTAVMAGTAGLNIVYEAAGMYASLLGFSLDSMIVDNDCLGAAMRVVRGIEVNEDTLSLDTIRSVCLEGPGHYLGHKQTLAVMQTEYLYPEIGDRTSPKEWEERGRPDLLQQAIARRKAILKSHYPAHVTPDLDARMRAAANILLPKS
jgi:trimethylamine--corrinoid protein Co-methyltransferase